MIQNDIQKFKTNLNEDSQKAFQRKEDIEKRLNYVQ